MESERFDTLARALARGLSRRRALAGLAALTGTALSQIDAAAAKRKKRGKKKKKKAKEQPGGPSGPRCPQPANPNFCASTDTCLPACPAEREFAAASCECVCPNQQTCCGDECSAECQDTIIKTDTLWTLPSDCTTTETIVIPNGVTIDGKKDDNSFFKITMAGPASGYQNVAVGDNNVRAGLLIQNDQNGNGSVRNLTIDQGPLDCDTAQAHAAIVMVDANGDIALVTIENSNTDANITCYSGIEAAASLQLNTPLIDLSEVTVSGIRRAGVTYRGNVRGTIADSAVDGHFAIQVFGPLDAAPNHSVTVAGNTVNSTFSGVNVGGGLAKVTVQGNTIAGQNGSTNAHGVLFQSASTGSVSGNTISNFGCGVSILDANAVNVSIEDDNIFPPPEAADANDENICDARE